MSKLAAIVVFATLATIFISGTFAATPPKIVYTNLAGPGKPVNLYAAQETGGSKVIYANIYNKSSVRYSPNYKQIAFTETANNTDNFQGDGGSQGGYHIVWVAKADGSSPRKISYFKDPQDYEPVWLSNGKQLAVNGSRQNAAGNLINNVWLLNLKGDKPTQLTDLAPNERLSGLSSVGSTVVFTKSYYDTSLKAVSEVYSVNTVTKKVQRLTVQGGYYQGAKLSPNGKLIAASKLDGKSMMRVVIMNSDGTGERTVNDPENGFIPPPQPSGQLYAASFDPDWSPDGRWLTAVGDVGVRPVVSYQSIRLIQVDTAASKDLTKPTSAEQFQRPIWSSNSKSIAFLALTQTTDNIDTIRVDDLYRQRLQANLHMRPDFDW